MAPYDWLASGQQLPRRIRKRIGVANSYVSKVINGTSMNFMDLFDMATSDSQVSDFINKQDSDKKKLAKRKVIDILVDAWNNGQFDIRQVYKGLGIVQEANQ